MVVYSEISRSGHWERGICIKLSEIDFRIRDKFATILCTLPLMYETNLRQICATPPLRTPPSRDLIRLGNRRAFRFQGDGGITSIVRWNLCPVIFGVDMLRLSLDRLVTPRLVFTPMSHTMRFHRITIGAIFLEAENCSVELTSARRQIVLANY